MIQNIPTADEFLTTGLEYVHMAYGGILGLVVALREFDPTDDDQIEYWNNARAKLLIHAGLAQQGIDFIIKSKIAQVSPFLLLENNPDRYPGNIKDGNHEYSDFFSIDSSKLIRVHDYFCLSKFTPEFKDTYEKSRKRRNKIIHTVDKNLEIAAEILIKEIIDSVIYLTSCNWLSSRVDYLEGAAEYSLYGFDQGILTSKVLEELDLFTEILKPFEFKKIVGIAKATRRYLCPECHDPDYNLNQLASSYLLPNRSDSTNLHCILCGSDFEIAREKCEQSGCPSNVIIADWGRCGMCWS